MKVRRIGSLWAVALLALAPLSLTLSGCGPASSGFTIPTPGGSGGASNPFVNTRIPTAGSTGYVLSAPLGGFGTFHMTIGADGVPTLTVDSASGDIKAGQVFTGNPPDAASGQFSLDGETGFGSPATIQGKLAKTGSTVTLSNFVINVNGTDVGHLSPGTTVTGTTSGVVPIGTVAGTYSGVVHNSDEAGNPTVANLSVTLGCNGTGTAAMTITAAGATFQKSAANASKVLDGTITAYDSDAGTFTVTVNAYDADPAVHTNIVISGTLTVASSGGSFAASGNLVDTESTPEHFTTTLDTFAPVAPACP